MSTSAVVSVVAHPATMEPSFALRAIPHYTQPHLSQVTAARAKERVSTVRVMQTIVALLFLAGTTVGWVFATLHVPPDAKGIQFFVHIAFAAVTLTILAALLHITARGRIRTKVNELSVCENDARSLEDPPPPPYERRGSLVGLLSGVHHLPTIPEMEETPRDTGGRAELPRQPFIQYRTVV
ncbi:hypothetical protein AURDEDRAFT_160398 [Auricularia subglabra TFB-10046 SS5]|nr:hypothetical protein AURDEDRAFT_160398 [Auricularia subglabra TFB-10046 SS5]